ncbi:MAG TPA: hypothetical protein VGF87_02500 [Acidimicrobiales bacterium]|jgi:hypothetical protein
MRAGFGTAPITPELPVMLAGFGDRHVATTEVHDPLEVRALYFDNQDHGVPVPGASPSGVCLLVCDLIGMSTSFSDPIRTAVAQDLGLPKAAVLTSSTHTHSGPSCIAGSEAIGWPTPPGYREILEEGCRTAARLAHASAVPATLSYRRAPLPDGLSVNRRGLPYAPWLALLEVRAVDGSRLGLLANLAVHPVALGPECFAVSSDWVGPFRTALESALGGHAIMLSGALGDVNPRHVHRQENECAGDGFDEAATLGRELAEAVVDEVPAATPLDEVIEVVRAEVFEAPIGGTMLSNLSRASTMSVDLVEWALGGARLVSLPGEAFHAFGRAIEASRHAPLLLAGLAPAWLGYLPMPFGEGYEEQMSPGESFVAALVAALT